MNAWFIIAEAWVYSEKWGAKVRDSVLWNALDDAWSNMIGTAYRTREEAEAVAVYQQAKLLSVGPKYDVFVTPFEGVLGHYGVTINAKEDA